MDRHGLKASRWRSEGPRDDQVRARRKAVIARSAATWQSMSLGIPAWIATAWRPRDDEVKGLAMTKW